MRESVLVGWVATEDGAEETLSVLSSQQGCGTSGSSNAIIDIVCNRSCYMKQQKNITLCVSNQYLPSDKHIYQTAVVK